MKKDIDVFTARDLRVRSSELIKDAKQGKLALITKDGKPAALSVPFDRRLVEFGVAQGLALSLFEKKIVSMSTAAEIAGVTLDVFMKMLARTGIIAVDYPAEELDKEMEVLAKCL